MTREEQTIHAAAKRYAILPSERNLGDLVTVVYNLPMVQWPDKRLPAAVVAGLCG